MKLRKAFNPMLIIILLFVIVVAVIGCSPKAEEEIKHTLRLYSSGEASMTYASMSGLSQIIRNANPNFWREVTTLPSAGPYAGFRAIANKEAEVTYSNIPQMIELYTNTGPMAENPLSSESRALLGLSLWEHSNYIITSADRDDINSIWDLKGKAVSFTLPGYTTEKIALEVHEAIGLDVDIVHMELDAIADALRDGAIDAAWAYVLSDIALPSWLAELELRVNAKIVNMTEEEVKDIASKVPGIAATSTPLSSFTNNIQGPEIIWYPTLGQFWVFSPFVPEEVVYEVATALYNNRAETTAAYAGHWIFEEKPFDLQKIHLDVAANAGIPIHPGVAKWLKENNAWNDSWIVGETIINN